MAVTLRYFTEFALQKTICGGIYAFVFLCVYNVVVEKVHVLYLIWWDSCFTCHPHTNYTCLYSPAARHHCPLAGTHCAYQRKDGQAELTWVAGHMSRTGNWTRIRSSTSVLNIVKQAPVNIRQLKRCITAMWQCALLVDQSNHFVSPRYIVLAGAAAVWGQRWLNACVYNALVRDTCCYKSMYLTAILLPVASSLAHVSWMSVAHSLASDSCYFYVYHLNGWLSKVLSRTKHIIGHIGDGFYGSDDPTYSVKALN